MVSKICTNRNTIIWLTGKHCGKRRNCSIRAISSFFTMFSKAVSCWCVKMSIHGVKGELTFHLTVPFFFKNYGPEYFWISGWKRKIILSYVWSFQNNFLHFYTLISSFETTQDVILYYLLTLKFNIYAPALKDEGHIVLLLSVCMPIGLSAQT